MNTGSSSGGVAQPANATALAVNNNQRDVFTGTSVR
jgi:hypothetical protein